MSMAASALPVTITVFAALAMFAITMFTMFTSAIGVSREVVPMFLAVNVSIRFGLLVRIWLSVGVKAWIGISVRVRIVSPVAGALVPGSVTIASSSIVASPAMALTSAPRDAGI